MPDHSLSRAFFDRDVLVVAPELLNKVLVAGECAGRIVEVEAYAPDGDEASHSFRGPTTRNASMFGRPGLLYVYFTYGMHWCVNLVCGAEGVGAAVLIRALEPLRGLEIMDRRRQAARQDTDLCSGPAKLAQALGINGEHDGVDAVAIRARVAVLDDGTEPPSRPGSSPRIGITKSTDRLWRYFVPGNSYLSR